MIEDFPQPKQNLERPKAIHDKRKGLMITSIIMFTLGLGFLIGTFIYSFENMLTGDKTTNALGLLLFLVTMGWVTYLPSLIFSIAGVCVSRFGLKSTSKAIRITCLVFLILNALIILALVVLGLIIAFIPLH